MSERTYSQVNTGISVREASFVSPSQFAPLAGFLSCSVSPVVKIK